MPRRQNPDEGELVPRMPTRVDSFHSATQVEINKPELISNTKLKKDPLPSQDGHRGQHKELSRMEINKRLKQAHSELSEKLFVDGENGLSVFDIYSQDNRNVLTSLDLRGQSVFHAVLIHVEDLINSKEKAGLVHAVSPAARDFLECLVIKHYDLLTTADHKKTRPLDMAGLKVKPIVFLVTDLIFSESMMRQLPVKACPANDNRVCSFQLPKSIQHLFARKGDDANSTDDSLLGACLHDIVNVEEVMQWNSLLKNTVKSVLKPCDDAKKSTILHDLLDDVNCFTAESSVNAESFRRLIELCETDTLLSQDPNGYCPLHKAVMLYEQKDIDFDRLHDVIQSLVYQCPKAIYRGNGGTNNKTPYSMLQRIERGQLKEGKELVSQSLELFKHVCIGSKGQSRDEKLIHLYGDLKHAKNIFLDMAFPNLINKDFIRGISEKVKFDFDTALEYVSLRRDPPDLPLLSPQVLDTNPMERNPYEGVFDWLQASGGVKKIFGITIEDRVPYPHTDESIIAALKPFQVEKWDWRKLDICSQTIIKAAPDTRELHLYSSGNNAVLREWSCKHGLLDLKKASSLACYISILRETKGHCKIHYDDFVERVRRRRPDLGKEIHLLWPAESMRQNSDSKNADTALGPNKSEEVAWVRTMEPFIHFIGSFINQKLERKRAEEKRAEEKGIDEKVYVNVALIDNGVSSTAEEIPKDLKGYSWYGDRSKDKKLPFRDYFTGPSLHGTQMAQCIYKVCPMVQLYVARMDDSSATEKFTVDSAIKAIRWAISMDVDIISMSWTFSIADMDEQQKTDFKTAIHEADRAGIVLLGSLNDKEQSVLRDWYPVSLNEVIRIGSATKWGEKAEPNRRGHACYLFPGEDIPLRAPPGPNTDGGQDEMASGSSLATAFAAGLAGLIIYASRASQHLDPDYAPKGSTKLIHRDGIEQAFKYLGGKPTEVTATDLFVELGSHFPKNPKKDADIHGQCQIRPQIDFVRAYRRGQRGLIRGREPASVSAEEVRRQPLSSDVSIEETPGFASILGPDPITPFIVAITQANIIWAGAF
ncbi:hypothetical protein F5Y10DRAFT_294016 [Nemania abortiva]|nr:hypothetical protein F5Y10DRAFT_294016 [Nemania abortiva]